MSIACTPSTTATSLRLTSFSLITAAGQAGGGGGRRQSTCMSFPNHRVRMLCQVVGAQATACYICLALHFLPRVHMRNPLLFLSSKANMTPHILLCQEGSAHELLAVHFVLHTPNPARTFATHTLPPSPARVDLCQLPAACWPADTSPTSPPAHHPPPRPVFHSRAVPGG